MNKDTYPFKVGQPACALAPKGSSPPGMYTLVASPPLQLVLVSWMAHSGQSQLPCQEGHITPWRGPRGEKPASQPHPASHVILQLSRFQTLRPQPLPNYSLLDTLSQKCPTTQLDKSCPQELGMLRNYTKFRGDLRPQCIPLIQQGYDLAHAVSINILVSGSCR